MIVSISRRRYVTVQIWVYVSPPYRRTGKAESPFGTSVGGQANFSKLSMPNPRAGRSHPPHPPARTSPLQPFPGFTRSDVLACGRPSFGATLRPYGAGTPKSETYPAHSAERRESTTGAVEVFDPPSAGCVAGCRTAVPGLVTSRNKFRNWTILRKRVTYNRNEASPNGEVVERTSTLTSRPSLSN